MAFVESMELTAVLPCLAEPGKIIVIGTPSRLIDGVLPLVAAVAPQVVAFNPAVGTLTLRRQPGFITFYPDRVILTQVKDVAEGLQMLVAVRDLLNRCWEQRETIEPVTKARRQPLPLDIWSLLPQLNCGACGEATCMAFAFALLRGEQSLGGCDLLVVDPGFVERRAQLEAML